MKLVSVTNVIKACRDPKDDKYLELAVSSGASCIITGDKDLLVCIHLITSPSYPQQIS
jgi:putative PIN family toxin of toxin-antitoxin system